MSLAADARVYSAPLQHPRGLVMSTTDGEVLLVDPSTKAQIGEAVVLPGVDKVLGVAVVGDVFYLATQESLINNDDDPQTLWGIDINSF